MRPVFRLPPDVRHLALGRGKGIEIGRHHEPVAIVERVDDRPVAAGIIGREHARGQLGQHVAQVGRGLDRGAGVMAHAPLALHVLGSEPEDHDVVAAHMLHDLDIGPVQRADGERTVQRELHVAGAGGLHARR